MQISSKKIIANFVQILKIFGKACWQKVSFEK